MPDAGNPAGPQHEDFMRILHTAALLARRAGASNSQIVEAVSNSLARCGAPKVDDLKHMIHVCYGETARLAYTEPRGGC